MLNLYDRHTSMLAHRDIEAPKRNVTRSVCVFLTVHLLGLGSNQFTVTEIN